MIKNYLTKYKKMMSKEGCFTIKTDIQKECLTVKDMLNYLKSLPLEMIVRTDSDDGISLKLQRYKNYPKLPFLNIENVD